MLNIIKMNAVGLDGKTPIMNFEFTFDNSTELPKGPGYQLGQRIYVIEEGSTAINNSTNIIYKYSSGKWIKTPNKSTSTTNTITENGSYNIASNIATGVGNIDVNVIGGGVTLIDKTITENGEYLPAQDEATAYSKVVVDVATGPSTGMPKLLTPTSVAQEVNNANCATIDLNKTQGVIPMVDNLNNQYIVFIKEVTGNLTIVEPKSGLETSRKYLIFKYNGNNIAIKYRKGSTSYDLKDVNETVIANSLQAGKTYKLSVDMQYSPMGGIYQGAVGSLDELDGDISFTLV